MSMLALKIIVIILAMLAAIHIIREWVDRQKRQKRNAALKGWIQKQDQPPTVIYRKVQIRLAHPQESD
jgi:sensor histidine kinase regulating citrate/malate metabolism